MKGRGTAAPHRSFDRPGRARSDGQGKVGKSNKQPRASISEKCVVGRRSEQISRSPDVRDSGDNMIYAALRFGSGLFMSHLTSDEGEVAKLAFVSKVAFGLMSSMRESIENQLQYASTLVETTNRESLRERPRRLEMVLGLLRREYVSIVLGRNYIHEISALCKLVSTVRKNPFRRLTIEFDRCLSMAWQRHAAASAAQAYPRLGADILFINAGSIYEVYQSSSHHKMVRHMWSNMDKEDALNILHTIAGKNREGSMTPCILASLVLQCSSLTGKDYVLSRLIHEANECLLQCMISVDASADAYQVRLLTAKMYTSTRLYLQIRKQCDLLVMFFTTHKMADQARGVRMVQAGLIGQ